MTREEILKAMVDGKVFRHKANGCFYFLSDCGALMLSANKDGKQIRSEDFRSWEYLVPVEEKRYYWLWVNPESGQVSTYYTDENSRCPDGDKVSYKNWIKLEWSKIEL